MAISATGLVLAWSHPTGSAQAPSGAWINYGLVGSSDIVGLVKGGFFIGIEVKTGEAKQSKEQLRFEHAVRIKDGHYFVARDVESAVEFVKSVAAGHRESLVNSQPSTISFT